MRNLQCLNWACQERVSDWVIACLITIDVVDLVVGRLIPVVQLVDKLHTVCSFLERLCEDWDLVFGTNKCDLDGLALLDHLGSLWETPAHRFEYGLR